MLNRTLLFLLGLFCIGCINSELDPNVYSISNYNDSIEKTIVRINAESKIKRLDSLFNHYHKLGGFNGNVLIAQSGIVFYKKSFGFANFKTKDSLNENSQFQLASISKQFTATTILILKERGLLDLNDSVQKYFPNFPYNGISIKLLLSHRSGLPNYIYYCDEIIKDKDTPITNDSVLNILVRDKPIRYYPPNKKFNYSNTGYVILASIVEKVSGISFEEFVQKEIFTPLEMDNSIIYNKAKKTVVKNKATGYLYREKVAEDNFLNGVIGDKGIYTTSEDLYKWDIGLYSDKIIKRTTINEAFEPANSDMKFPKNYGFGWRLKYLTDGRKMIYHRGWWQGFQNLLVRLESDSTTIVILRNRKTRTIINPYIILDILYPDKQYLTNSNSSLKEIDDVNDSIEINDKSRD
ncbi:MAG: hypothetical protein A2033_05100 [Bacteroidetes bacterium GWA2_31_9]|nr:MAG: hypothetical protein A2033_05100 [Bacteroidetes bacterium GWA2_31_9]